MGSCVTLGGSGSAAKKLSASAAVKGGNICLPGSATASEKLWVAQAELTLSMPKAEADALVSSIKKVGLQATRPSIVSLVPAAVDVFSKSPEAINMVAAGKDVEPTVIATVQAALK